MHNNTVRPRQTARVIDTELSIKVTPRKYTAVVPQNPSSLREDRALGIKTRFSTPAGDKHLPLWLLQDKALLAAKEVPLSPGQLRVPEAAAWSC